MSGQTSGTVSAGNPIPFNYSYWNGVADKKHLTAQERAEMIAVQKEIYDGLHSHADHDHAELVWVTEPAQAKGAGGNSVFAGPCTNIDFESGTTAGWVRSTGFNPLTNVLGCCPNPNGDQTIMLGAGTDPYGGFPVVYPGAGNFSLRLGSTATGGRADRISQTFFVTAANANFTYRYALVLNDGGHPTNEQPRFTSEIIDTLGNPVPCTFYQASAGSNSMGIVSSSLTAPNGSPISYKNWTNVLIDLTPNIGQNVTLRFTVYDCGPSGHFAYAYIDGSCTNFVTSVADTTCPNVPITMCAPVGFLSTSWNGPGVVNNPNTCISASLPGTYSCTTVLIPGCPGPTFTHTLSLLPNPTITFTPISSGPCSSQYTFNSTVGVAPGSIVSRQWFFGDGTSSTALNPVHNYTTPGIYQVKLKATTNRGCSDSLIKTVTVNPFPNLVFSPPSNCINTVIQFTNTSSISMGSITGYTWTLGNGPTSNVTNPVNSYSANGTYTITLNAISNIGCASALSQTLGIYPPPIISFSASPLCDINGTSFTPFTSTAIASGSLSAFLWDFGDGGTSNQAMPVHVYNSPGIYTVNFTAWSNHNCPATVSNSFQISPSPTVAFSTTSVNACSLNFTFTNNSAISSGPISYTWSMGTGFTTTNTSLSYTFPSIGSYTVKLVGISNMGCTDTAYNYISVYPYPIINFSVPASCEKAIFTVSTTAVSGSVTSYLWDFGDLASGAANTSTLQNPTHFYSTTNNYTITLNLLSNLNCPSSTVQPITVFPNPKAQFTSMTSSNCSPTFTFVNTSSVSTVGSSFIQYNNWMVGNNAIVAPPTPIALNVPGPGAYTASLVVTTNHNCTDTALVNLVVHPMPQIAFSAMSSCHDQPISFVSSSSISSVPIPGSISSYSWNFGDNSSFNAINPPPHAYPASGTYSVTFYAVSNMNCVAALTKTVTVYPMALTDFTVTDLCLGQVAQFSSTFSLASGVINSFNWTFGDGWIGSNPAAVHNYSTSGTYNVSYTVTTDNECATVVSKPITINPLPAPSFSVNGGCLNTLSQFIDGSTISAGSIATYSWNFGDGNGANTQLASNTYTAFGNYTPTLTLISAANCYSSTTNTLVIHPLPVIAFSPPGACLGSSVQFTNTSFIPLGSITSYTWDFADGSPASGLLNPSHTFTQANTYNVQLSATSNQGCVNSGLVNLVINPLPQASVTPIFNSCVNDGVLINANMSITSGSVSSYTITYGDGGVGTYTNTTPASINSTHSHTYSAYNTYTLTLKANSDKNCSVTVSDTVKVYPKPFVNFTPNSVCFGENIVFNNLSNIPSPGTYSIQAHLWQFNDGSASPTSTLSNPTHLFPGNNTYTVYNVMLTEFSFPEAQNLTSTLTCSASAVKSVTVFPTPATTFTNSNACLGSPTTFSNTTNAIGIVGWSWYFDTIVQLNSIAQHPSFTYTSAGVHTSTLVALNNYGCKDTASQQVVVYFNPVASFVSDSVCLGTLTSFTNTSTYGSGSTAQYTWNTIGGNNFSFNTSPPTHQLGVSGPNFVKLTAKSDLGCLGTFTSAVIVHPLPAVKFTANAPCLGKPTLFTNLTSGATTFSWNFGEPSSGLNNTSTLLSPVHSYSSSGSFAAMLTATNTNNCVGDTIINLVVHSNPVANFLHKPVCMGDLAEFTNISTSSDGTLSAHHWDFNGDNIIDQAAQTPTYSYAQGGTSTVNLIVVSQYGCEGVSTKTVFINPKAIPEFGSDNQKGCPPLCVNFKNMSSISSGSYTIKWDFGDNSPIDSDNPNPSHCYAQGNYDVTLMLLSDAGCKSTLRYPGYAVAYPNPVAGFISSPDEVDENEPVIALQSTASPDVVFLRYHISDGANYYQPNVTHVLKNLDGKVKPMVVQIVKNAFNCADTVYKLIDMKPAYTLFIPNTFTPNGDNFNDTFQAKGVGITSFAMQIFDRWGHRLFETTDIYVPWDGKKNGEEIKQDTYVWKAQVTDVRGQKHSLIGHVNLIR